MKKINFHEEKIKTLIDKHSKGQISTKQFKKECESDKYIQKYMKEKGII